MDAGVADYDKFCVFDSANEIIKYRTAAEILEDIEAVTDPHYHAAAHITSGTLPVTRGGLGNTAFILNQLITYDGTNFYSLPDLTHAQLFDLLNYRAAQVVDIPMTLMGTNNNAFPFGWRISNGLWSNINTTNHNVNFQLDLPTIKGTLRLYTIGYKIIINGDGSNYIDTTLVKGLNTSGFDTLDTLATNLSSDRNTTFVAIDCSSYDKIILQCAVVLNTINALDLYPTMKCYYAKSESNFCFSSSKSIYLKYTCVLIIVL